MEMEGGTTNSHLAAEKVYADCFKDLKRYTRCCM